MRKCSWGIVIYVVILVIYFFLSESKLSFADETLTITTYYPSPYGVYKNLHVEDLEVYKKVDSIGGTITTSEVCVKDKEGNFIQGTCENPDPSGGNCVEWQTIRCSRTYRPAVVIGQAISQGGEATAETGSMGLLSYAYATDGYTVTDGKLSVNIPWPSGRIAILGVSDSAGVYGMSVGNLKHPGVVGYSNGQYGVWGISKGMAAICADARGESSDGLKANAKEGRSIYALNIGSGPAILAYKPATASETLVRFQHDGEGNALHVVAIQGLAMHTVSSQGVNIIGPGIMEDPPPDTRNENTGFVYIAPPSDWEGNALRVWNQGNGIVGNFFGEGGIWAQKAQIVGGGLTVSGGAEISGTLSIKGSLKDNSDSSGSSGDVLTSTGNGVKWSSFSAVPSGTLCGFYIRYSDGTERKSGCGGYDLGNRECPSGYSIEQVDFPSSVSGLKLFRTCKKE